MVERASTRLLRRIYMFTHPILLNAFLNFIVGKSFEFGGLSLDNVLNTSSIQLNANRILKTLVNRTATNLTIVRKPHLTTDYPKTHVQLFLNTHLNFLWFVVVACVSIIANVCPLSRAISDFFQFAGIMCGVGSIALAIDSTRIACNETHMFQFVVDIENVNRTIGPNDPAVNAAEGTNRGLEFVVCESDQGLTFECELLLLMSLL
jgi:hypothetical protein